MTVKTVDPRLKLAWCLTCLLAAFTLPSIMCQCLLILLILALQWGLTKSLKHLGVLTVVLMVIGLQLIIVQLLFCREGTLLWQWGFLKIYSQAIPKAISGFLRTSSLAYAGVQFLSWTSAQDATLMLCAFGLTYRYAMLVGVTARFFPVMQQEYAAISESQSVRGLPTEGFWQKLKALPPTFFPLLYRAMRRSADTGLSMELRGFGRDNTRTFTKDLHLKPWEVLGIVVLVAACITLIITRIAIG